MADRKPPERIWVTWCEECGTVVLADRKRHEADCHLCVFGKGRTIGVRYQLARKNGVPEIDNPRAPLPGAHTQGEP